MSRLTWLAAAVALVAAWPLSGSQGQQRPPERASMETEIIRTGSVTVYGIAIADDQRFVQSSSEPVLRGILALLQSHDEWRFEVQGHTDSAGGRAASQARSDREARAVVAWLTGHAVAAERLVATGYGDTRPVADNATGGGRARNRRVVLKKLNEE